MRLTLLMSIVVVASCGDANQLWGSIRESYPMEFDRVEIVRQGHALRIEYVREHGDDQEWVCKLTVNTEGLGLSDHAEIRAQSFTDRVVVERNTDEQADPLPRYTGGLLHFERFGTAPGDAIEGDFNVLFDNGRNLAGTFSSMLAVVTPGLLPQGEGEVPLSMPTDPEPPQIGAPTMVGASCAACSPHGALVAIWLVSLLLRRRTTLTRPARC